MRLTVPFSEAQANLSELVDEVIATRQPMEITRSGAPVAVLLSTADYAALAETLNILSDAELVRDISQGQETQGEDVTTDSLLSSLDSARRGCR